MRDESDIEPPAQVSTVVRVRRRRRRAWRVLGTGLIAWGIIGLVLLAVFFNSLAAPIAQLDTITGSVENQRTAALQSLQSAHDTVNQTVVAIRGMDTSLADARVATSQASSIALGISSSMTDLANQMSLTVFGVQPLIGLASGFTSSATQLSQLSTQLDTIGLALDANRTDALAVASSLDGLGASLDTLKTAINQTPPLEGATKALDTVRVGILALLIWLGVLAVGSILGGISCWLIARAD